MSITILKSLLVCSAIGLLVVLLGCETEPSEQIALSITPNTVSLRAGQSQEFVASGFEDYTWEIKKSGDARGVLSTTKGNSTVYTAVSGTNGIVDLIVSANAQATRTNQNDTDPPARGRVSAKALIQHRP